MRAALVRLFGRLLAYHYHQSGAKLDWYAWGSLMISTSLATIVLSLPVVHAISPRLEIDMSDRGESRPLFVTATGIIFLLNSLLLYALRNRIREHCLIELERTLETRLKKVYMRYIGVVAIGIVAMIVVVGSASRYW